MRGKMDADTNLEPEHPKLEERRIEDRKRCASDVVTARETQEALDALVRDAAAAVFTLRRCTIVRLRLFGTNFTGRFPSLSEYINGMKFLPPGAK